MVSGSSVLNGANSRSLSRDLIAGVVVFLVALPLCLGIAQASGAAPIAGMIAGILGGLVVGMLSGSHTSVSGPAAGLTAIVLVQIESLGSFEAFLLALLLSGVIQIVLGFLKAGFLAAYFPMSVIRGLLTAIGVILILKQFPHLIGRDADPEGDMAFFQTDRENTFSELIVSALRLHPGAATVGLASLAILILWDKVKLLKKSIIPGPFVVVIVGVVIAESLAEWAPSGARWHIGQNHLVQVPVAQNWSGVVGFIRTPDFSQIVNPAIYIAAITIAIVASLETLLNLEAVDKLDPQRRYSPPSRELFAQGVGNAASGLIGGIPITSVIVRSSVNINAGATTKTSAIFHGALLLSCLILIPAALNRIPLASLAAILMVTGFKLASPKIVKAMWAEGWTRFLPYVITVVAIVLTDLLIGILIGLAVSLTFILWSNLKRPVKHIVERHASGDVHRIELASQVSFLNRAILDKALRKIPRGSNILFDARNTHYIDPDVMDYINEYKASIAPARGMTVSLLGFQGLETVPDLDDDIQFVDYSSRDLQHKISPAQVLELLKSGNQRFRAGQPLTRYNLRQVRATAGGQFPIAVVLSCIDSRTPAEIVFDCGLGDVFSVRIAGNILSDRVLGSIEYASQVAGAKMVLVLGHTRCGAVTAAVELSATGATALEATGCEHLDAVTTELQRAIDDATRRRLPQLSSDERKKLADDVSRQNVRRVLAQLREQSPKVAELERKGQIALVGALYDVCTGEVEWLEGMPPTPANSQPEPALSTA